MGDGPGKEKQRKQTTKLGVKLPSLKGKVFSEILSDAKAFGESRNEFYSKLRYLSPGLAESLKIAEFYEIVKTGGWYDLKVNPDFKYSNGNLGSNNSYFFEAMLMQPQDFGNYSFGVLAKAYGYSEIFVRAGTGDIRLKTALLLGHIITHFLMTIEIR